MAALTRCLVLVLLVSLLSACSQPTVRVATFNTALSRPEAGQLHAAFENGGDEQAKLVAEVLQRTRPDIVLLQEVDYDPTGKAYEDFQRNYLGVSQNGAEPITYEHVYAPPVNTGVLAPVDLDGDGQITRPNDCFGYGLFEGHYGMVVLSRYPILVEEIQSFREALWKDRPSHIPLSEYTKAARDHLRLSSKTHAVLPILIESNRLELMISHPTPPVFDGPEDRNGHRNYDEIGLWRTYLTNSSPDKHLVRYPKLDGKGQVASYRMSGMQHRFIILGDLNADPKDGESRFHAISQLLVHPWINRDIIPTSAGAIEAAKQQGGKNLTHRSDSAADTADFGDGDRGPGNLRVDYVLPSIDLDVVGSGVYWPTTDDPHAYLNRASDHRLVWVDIRLP